MKAQLLAVLMSVAMSASATTYQFGSYATGQPAMGNQNSAVAFDVGLSTVDPGSGATSATVALAPGGPPIPPYWAAPLPNSTWVSFGQTGPTTPFFAQPGGHFAPNGDYFFTSTFTLDAQAVSYTFSVLADDTTTVFLDGQTGNALVQASSGNNVICNTVQPNCLDIDTVTSAGPGGAQVLALLTPGTHTLTFDVQQLRSIDLGIDFSATVVTAVGAVSPIPEPNTLLLLATGLFGSAGILARRRLT